MYFLVLIICVVVIVVINDGHASQYDPHLYPPTGPFFEGWYTRLTDTDSDRSFGVLFGRVLPTNNQSPSTWDSNPTTYISLVCSKGQGSPMVVVQAYPDEDDIEVTVHGQPINKDPSLQAPSYFEYVVRPYGFYNVTPNSTVFNFTIDGVTFAGNFTRPLLWDSTGQGELSHIRLIGHLSAFFLIKKATIK